MLLPFVRFDLQRTEVSQHLAHRPLDVLQTFRELIQAKLFRNDPRHCHSVLPLCCIGLGSQPEYAADCTSSSFLPYGFIWHLDETGQANSIERVSTSENSLPNAQCDRMGGAAQHLCVWARCSWACSPKGVTLGLERTKWWCAVAGHAWVCGTRFFKNERRDPVTLGKKN